MHGPTKMMVGMGVGAKIGRKGGVGRQNVGGRASNEGAGCRISHVRALN